MINKEISKRPKCKPHTDKDEKFFLVPKNIAKPDSGLKVDVSLLAIYIKQRYDIRYYKNQFRVFKNYYYSYVENMKTLIYKDIPEMYRLPNNIRDCVDLLTMDQDLILMERDLAPEKYILFKNGVLDVETMQFSTHEEIGEKLIFINQVGYEYDPNVATCKYADNFFSKVTNGKQEDINFLYQVLGVLISGYRDFKNIFYFTGKKDSGKSTFLKITELLLTNPDGTNDFSSIGLRTLVNETSKEFTRIIGKRANICGENPEIKISNDTLLKQLSGGDTITARVKFKDPVEFVNRAMLIFSGNEVPSFFTSDKSAIGERMLIYVFKNVIPVRSQIKKFEKKINMSYVLNKAIEQLRIFLNNNQEFTVPQEILNNREKLLIDSDTVYRFYKEYVIVTNDPKDRVSNHVLYDAYINYLVEEGHVIKYNGRLDINKIKITQYVFTVQIKKHHGEERYKRKLAYRGAKADCFICMILK
ncbi:MAG: phage/plasmid primase, P4 family [Sedimentibacter sp.]